ncbi:hypothetical protein BDZ45DRAFT_478805 [Acephala macrosclerotiorum]|nr:hypothetical protein BDZ45DRAFT_478805 [Acephala macrosclerotiorum]
MTNGISGPRMMEKLLLCIQYECHRDGLLIPWDKIVHRLNPGSSGPSAVQMLCKMREVLITEGHFIPPSLGKRSMMIDPKIRGYTRDKDKPEPWAARTVSWMEEIDHPKESMTDNGVICGSGKYRLANPDHVAEINERREMIEGPLAAPAYPLPGMPNGPPADLNAPRNSEKRSTPLKPRVRNKAVDDEGFEENDPDENDPDGDYDPEVPKRTRRRPAVRASRARRSSIFDEVDEDSDDSPRPISRSRPSLAVKTPAPMSQSSSRQPSTTPSKSFGHGGKLSYEGPEEHGTIAQFSKAVMDGKDPSVNGTRYQSRGTSAEDSIEINDGAKLEVASTTPKTPGNVDHSLTNAGNGVQLTGTPGTGGVSRLQLDNSSPFNTSNRLYPVSALFISSRMKVDK